MSNETTKKGIVLSLLQEKGGCGKSSATFNIASYLSQHNKVLIIDMDGQAADVTYFLFGNKIGSAPNNTRDNVLTVVDILRKDIDVTDAVVHLNENLHAIPANTQVCYLAQGDKVVKFRRSVEQLQETYDYILIDVPPSPSWAHVLCLSVCDYVIPIVNPEPASPIALISINDSIEDIKAASNPHLEYLGIVMNKYDERTKLAKTMLDQIEHIADQLGTCMFRTMIHQSVTLSEHVLLHKNIFEYAPKSKAAEEYKSLAEEILDRLNSEQEAKG